MKLISVKKITDDNKVILVGLVHLNETREKEEKEIELYFKYPRKFANFVSETGDAFLPTLLLPAMYKGESLEIKTPISKQLFHNLHVIQSIFHQWYPEDFKKIQVSADCPIKYEHNSNEGVGSFFSLGVDSFYTLHKHFNSTDSVLPSLSHLIHMKGIEFPLAYYKNNREKEVLTRIKEVAKETGTDYIFGETNIRTHFPLKWGQHYHGAGLASVALSLSQGLKTVLIPSTDSYKKIFHWGSSPLIDHWWSTEKTAVFHDGSEVERAEKTSNFLSKDPLAMKYLRVCLKNYGGVKNCGKCTKCVRTMLPLHISGKLPMFKTFPDRLPRNWANILDINDEHDLSHAEAILALGEESGADSKLLKVLSDKIETSRSEIFLRDRNILNIFKSMIFLLCFKPIIKQTNNLLEKLKRKRIWRIWTKYQNLLSSYLSKDKLTTTS